MGFPLKIKPVYSKRLLAATTLLSVALIAYQVSIIQLLSYMQWHHYANMVISVGLLGFGAAGTFLSILRSKLIGNSEAILPVLMILCGLTMAISVRLSQSSFARFDSYLFFVDRRQVISLLINYLVFFLPFFFGALALGIIFVKFVTAIDKLYFFNLLGSGIGAVIIAVLAGYFFPAFLPVVIAFSTVVAALLLLNRKNSWIVLSLFLLSMVIIISSSTQPADTAPSEYKSLSRTLHLPSAEITLRQPSAYGFIEVVDADAMRFAPGLSLAFTGEVPVKKAIFNNGDWFGALVSWNSQDSFHLLDYTTMALPYILKKRENLLVLRAGTGIAVSQALSNGAVDIDAVEPHRPISQLLLNELAADSDSLYHQPGVRLYASESRTFLSVTKKKYDLVQLPLIGAFGGGAGLYSMKEEYLLTKEAILQAWQLLKDDGVISINCWMDYPFRNPLKIAATIAETAEAAGIATPLSHIIAVRSWATVSFILKKSPVTANDTMRARRFCNTLYFDPLLMPGLLQEERSVFNQMNDSSLFAFTDKLITGERKMLYGDYDFFIRPATDNKPYFSQFLRMKTLPHLNSIFGSHALPFLELGWLIAIITFLQLTLLAVLFIILPLFKIGWKGKARVPTFFYFSGLGIGYMFLEIVLIQRFLLFLGNPVYSVALVIAVMMLASGVGSFFSARIHLKKSVVQKLFLAIVIILLLYSFTLTALLQSIIRMPGLLKLVVSVLVISLPSFLMGMPFPIGLKVLSQHEEKNLPWAWGINGCMSVISAAMATLLAVELGFIAVMLLAAFAYVISLLAANVYMLRYEN